MDIQIKRIYEPVAPDDGARVLVDGIWPRGMSKARAELHSWQKEVAPSTELRRWFDHRPERWEDFRTRYRSELARNAGVDELIALVHQGRLTLLYSARDTDRNQAVVLAEWIAEPPRS